MSVKKEPSGRRFVQSEVEVPGTPEEVWQAVATGPGVSSWFVPTEMEIVDGKAVAVKSNFGPGMESSATVTAWDPPRMFSAESPGWMPEMPSMATQWTVEAKAGGSCLVRVMHSLFSDKDDWDGQLEGTEHGWPGFFRTLRLYLTHFRGQRSAIVQKMAMTPSTEADAWSTLTTALGLTDATVGKRWTAPAGVPPLAGVVEHATLSPNDILVRLDTPTPGVVSLGTYSCGQTMVGVNLYLYGDAAAGTAAVESPKWDAWMQERFPAPTA
jgi:uncharacterized protein YndB with AHSA1/START domain